MTNKIKLSSFILFSTSTVFLIISIVFFYLFNRTIPKPYAPAVYCVFFSTICGENYYILNSNIQMYYLPGLIFYGISLFLAIAGVILFRIYFFRKRSINEEQIEKERKYNDNRGLLESSFVIFVIVIALLLFSLVYFIRLQRCILSTTTYYGDLIPPLNFLGVILFPRSLSLQTISVILSYKGYVNIFSLLDIILLHKTEKLVTISVILSIIGIILFAGSFFIRNKAIERKTQENI